MSGPSASEPAQRSYETVGSLSADERVAIFEERLVEYDARVSRCSPAALTTQLERVLADSGRTTFGVPGSLPEHWQPRGFTWIRDDALSLAQLDAVDGALTGATCAIASTGTIVLLHGPLEGRRVLTLLPDYHLCVLFAEQIVETVPEAFVRIAPSARALMTFISGPSATADIEMTRIKGVHGPRTLEVILVVD